MSSTKHMGILYVTPEVLLRALNLPEDSNLHGVDTQFDVNGTVVRLKIEQAGLPPVHDGDRITRVTAVYHASHPTRLEFKGWS